MKKSDYRTNETTVFCCRYHVIFCPKYRRKVLIHGIDERFKEIVLSMQEEQNFKVLGMEVMPDHVHLLLDVDPTIGVNTLVGRIKGKTAHILCREYPEIRRRIPTLWTRSKFIATVGSVSLDVVKKYIEDQKSTEQRKAKKRNA
ncbi:MAG TPA: IS200/IS605 family transposase [Erysipelotrichaceae bacterium]|nr:IS200/IS605 family transposase [Erysipelotrichaceae bacterium]